MYKKEREISDKTKMIEILNNEKFVSISLCRNNEPYILTLNYGFDKKNNCLYFHTALKGMKLDIIIENPQVCASVIKDMGYVHGKCSHKYKSVVFWGDMKIVDDLKEKKYGMDILLKHPEKEPEPIKKRNFMNDDRYNKVCILRLNITDIYGKEGL